jgi:hypothetical protein
MRHAVLVVARTGVNPLAALLVRPADIHCVSALTAFHNPGENAEIAESVRAFAVLDFLLYQIK